jgi:hypothetical protein
MGVFLGWTPSSVSKLLRSWPHKFISWFLDVRGLGEGTPVKANDGFFRPELVGSNDGFGNHK